MAPPKVEKSDGSSTGYYKIQAGATDLIDLIEHKKMSFGTGNIFKAVYRLGEKDGADEAYDLRKIIFFAERRLAELKREAMRRHPQMTIGPAYPDFICSRHLTVNGGVCKECL